MKIDELRLYANRIGLTKEQLLDITYQKNWNYDIEEINKKLESILNKETTHKNKTEIKAFKIYDLFETNNNYNFTFTDDINIFVSENGIGKTSILRLLVAILEKDIAIINEIEFSRAEITINNKRVIIDKKEINNTLKKDYEKCLFLLRRILKQKDYISIKKEFDSKNRFNTEKFEDDLNIFIKRNRDLPYFFREVRDEIHKLNEKQQEQIQKALNESLSSELLFYPTYRKIETQKEKIFYSRFKDDVKVIDKYISFGMDEVRQRIDSILEEIRISTNISYAKITSEIINELFENNIDALPEATKEIDKDKFKIIMERIGEQYNGSKLPIDFETKAQNKYLIYYINKIISIYDTQKKLSSRIKEFINISNKYLVNKEFIYNEADLTVEIKIKGNAESFLDLDELSSGEKQIVSIFSKIYLDVTLPCIFIIDEPELSLSIDWQKTFLTDIYNSNKIGLMIATTHSPFIFKDDLFEFTKNINICQIGE